MNRLLIEKLIVAGEAVIPAEFDFQRGLNAITGPEDRGKTYAFQCLDFIFGAKSAPKTELDEGEGYATATAQLLVGDKRFRLVRRFSDKQPFVSPSYEGDNVPPVEQWQKLAKSKAKKDDISAILMRALGFPDQMLRTNDSGELGAMSIRHIMHLCMISEMRMIDDRSPLLSDRGFADTLYKEAFGVIIGARENPPTAEDGVRQSESRGTSRHAVIEEMIRDTENSLAAYGQVDEVDANEMLELSKQMEGFRERVAATTSQLSGLLADREAIQSNIAKNQASYRSRIEHRYRLRLLAEYYESDLRRLDAISESGFYLQQLGDLNCPTCDQSWLASPVDSEEFDISNVMAACRAEADKIRMLLGDLASELKVAEEEVVSLASNIASSELSLRGISESYSAIESELEKANRKLAESLTKAPRHAELFALRHRLTQLQALLPQDAPPAIIAPPSNKLSLAKAPIDEVCDIISALLKSWNWNYTKDGLTVEFDPRTFDIRIAGRPRASFGKAVRGIIASALSLAIMEYCLLHELPHPGFVVLDSPLTSQGGQDPAGRLDKISSRIQGKFFFEIGSRFKHQQVIIMDNKVPLRPLPDPLLHYRFGNDAKALRSGFFPINT